MCPICIAAAAVMAGKAALTGGLTAIVIKRKTGKENADGYQPDRTAEDENRIS